MQVNNKKIDISVILVNYNTKKMTSECIDSIISHTSGVSYEIILVDNNSTDGSKEFFSNDKRVTYIYNEKNGGFGYGNNIGMEHSHGKYIFLLNTDTLLINNAIKEFFDYAENYKYNTVYGCWLVNKEGKDICSYYNFPAFTFKEFWNKHILGKDKQDIDHKEKEVDVIVGADMFIPRKVISTIGGFDTNIFLHGEEGEFQYRMKENNIRRMLIPQPKIIHLVNGSGIIRNINMKGHFIFLKRHMALWKYYLARIYYFLIYFCLILKNHNIGWTGNVWKEMTQKIDLHSGSTNVNLSTE